MVSVCIMTKTVRIIIRTGGIGQTQPFAPALNKQSGGNVSADEEY